MAKILMVDDEEQFLSMMTMRLEANGYEVITAMNGEEGIEKAKSETPDLILLDVMMPGKNGFEVCQILKGDEQCQNIPIIICTAMAQNASIEKGKDAGADDVATKPFDHKVLLGKIAELIKE